MEPKKLADDSLPPRLWLISNKLQDLVTTEDIIPAGPNQIPAIKTDHAAISIEFSITEKTYQRPWPLETELFAFG